jgi:hypothetical protein
MRAARSAGGLTAGDDDLSGAGAQVPVADVKAMPVVATSGQGKVHTGPDPASNQQAAGGSARGRALCRRADAEAKVWRWLRNDQVDGFQEVATTCVSQDAGAAIG